MLHLRRKPLLLNVKRQRFVNKVWQLLLFWALIKRNRNERIISLIWKLIRAQLSGRLIVISLSHRLFFCPSVLPSVCRPSVRPRSFVRSILSLHLVQSGAYFTHRVPLGKVCVVTINHVSRLKLKVIAEIYRKILVRSKSSLPLVRSSWNFTYRKYMVKGCAMTLNAICKSRVKVILYHRIKIFFQSIFTLHITLFGSCLTITELLSKGCAETLNQVSRWNMKIVAE